MWKEAQKWENDWWGNCVNTYGEEEKQLLYANRMGLKTFHNSKSPYNFDMQDNSILDIGGGPTSLLLKCVNFSKAKVVDPLIIPHWVSERYSIANIEFEQLPGEDIKEIEFDEVWMYNVLQHTENPKLIIDNAKQAGKIIRLFEWINTPTNVGHPHSFTQDLFDGWLNGYGQIETLKRQANCWGDCYYGIFIGKGN